MARRIGRALLPLAAFIIILAMGVGAWLVLSHRLEDVAGVSIGGPFALVDGQGKPVTDRDFRGRYLLVYFGYTFCPDVCPTTLNEIAGALDKLGPKADQLAVVFITVDPKRDTPAVLRDYVAAFNPHIVGLTGTPQQIADVARAYRVYYAPQAATGTGSGYAVDHSSVLYLMGPDGAFIEPLRTDQSGEAMAAVIGRHLL